MSLWQSTAAADAANKQLTVKNKMSKAVNANTTLPVAISK